MAQQEVTTKVTVFGPAGERAVFRQRLATVGGVCHLVKMPRVFDEQIFGRLGGPGAPVAGEALGRTRAALETAWPTWQEWQNANWGVVGGEYALGAVAGDEVDTLRFRTAGGGFTSGFYKRVSEQFPGLVFAVVAACAGEADTEVAMFRAGAQVAGPAVHGADRSEDDASSVFAVEEGAWRELFNDQSPGLGHDRGVEQQW